MVCIDLPHSVFLMYFCLLFSLRRRMPFMPKKSKQSLSSDCSCSSPSPLLQQPLISMDNYQEKGGEGMHLHNVDYFFPPCESYRC